MKKFIPVIALLICFGANTAIIGYAVNLSWQRLTADQKAHAKVDIAFAYTHSWAGQ